MSNTTPPKPQPEPWLRGSIPGVNPMAMPVFFSFTQVREDLAAHTKDLKQDDVWKQLGAVPTLGFQLGHIAGSVDRLTTYLMEEPISPEQIAILKQESAPGKSLEELLKGIDAALRQAEEKIATIDPEKIHEPRYIGRARLPTTVLGLLVHIAEHTQRHLGQAITTAKLLQQNH